MSRKSLAITIYKSELVYDIQNKTYLTGRSRADGISPEQVAAMQANGDDENLNQILRSIGSAFAGLKPLLGEYISGTDTTANDILEDSSTNLTLSLSLPENFNQAEAAAVANGIHDYIVNSAVAEWFQITKPDEAASYAASASANILQIRSALAKRNRPTRTAVSS